MDEKLVDDNSSTLNNEIHQFNIVNDNFELVFEASKKKNVVVNFVIIYFVVVVLIVVNQKKIYKKIYLLQNGKIMFNIIMKKKIQIYHF